MNNSCSHKRSGRRIVREEVWCDYHEDYVIQEDYEIYEETAFEDMDTHRLKCSICGKIEYYSQSARDHYENGIPSPWVVGRDNRN